MRMDRGWAGVVPALVLVVTLMTTGCPEELSVHDSKPPGPMERYDPLATWEAVRDFTGPGAQLLKINARYVRPDGTMDLEADYDPYVVYTFLRPRAGASKKPVGAGGGVTHDEVIVRVGPPGYLSTTRTGGARNVKMRRGHDGMVEMNASAADADDLKEVVPGPTCTTQQLWASAREAGAPAEAVAIIQYGKRGYRFVIDEIDFEQQLNFACAPGREASARHLEREARDALKDLAREARRQAKEEKKRDRDALRARKAAELRR